MLRLTSAIALAAVAVPFATQAQTSSDPAVCGMQAAGLAEGYVAPPRGGDEDFFISHGGVPNVLFVIDTSGSMRDLPRWPAAYPYGCNDPYYASLGYDSAKVYDPYDAENKSRSFRAGVYQFDVDDWRVFDETPGTLDGYCDNVGRYDSSAEYWCRTCLANRGYFRFYDRVLTTGNFLNFFPPKYAMARRSLKKVLQEVRRIRMGIVGLNTEDGGHWITSAGLNPSCSMSWPPKDNNFDSNRQSMLNAIDNMQVDAFSGGTPIAEALFNAGEFHTAKDREYEDFGFRSYLKKDFEGERPGNQATICWECQSSNVIVVSDGTPCNDNDDIPWDIRGLGASIDSPLNCSSCGKDKCNGTDNVLHKVAWFLRNHDLRADMEGAQTITTHTVGFYLDDTTLLQRAADLGQGLFRNAGSEEGLANAVKELLDIISNRASSFTSSSFAGVQSHATQSILVPRFRASTKLPWEGRLFRFDFVSEFVIGVDLDEDGDKSSFFLVGRGCEDVTDWSSLPATCRPLRSAETDDIDQNPDLEFGMLYRMQSFTDRSLSDVAGVPFWEGAEELQKLGPENRRIYTALPGTSSGNITYTSLAFDEAHVTDLIPYLGLEDPAVCQQVLGFAGLPTTGTKEQCARVIIRYVRGCQLGDPTLDCVPREHLLPDIYHSSPVIIDPPTPRQILKTPFRHDQSMVTLAMDNDPFGLDMTELYGRKVHPYDKFVADHEHRDRVALVGSNGGLLHAFHTGGWSEDEGWDRGTGEELWALVPPDLLPKLWRFVTQEKHELFVDGTPWIRNVWVDGLGTKSYVREWPEYRTVAVVGERQGGNRYFALDVTDAHLDVNGRRLTEDGSGAPKITFLWSYPEPTSMGAALMGQTWTDITPLPPPIGPIRLKAESATGATYRGVDFEERWVVALPGGYDPGQNRGRAFGLLDAWTGKTIWAATYEVGDPVLGNMTHSFAAVPALTGWGRTAKLGYDQPYFDLMVLGDTGGQVWASYFNHPDPEKWQTARVFQERKSDSASDRAWRNPFFNVASLVPLEESGTLRAYLGTGDRAHLLEEGGGLCSTHNLTACIRAGCEVVQARNYVKMGDKESAQAWSYDSTGWHPNAWSFADGGDACEQLHVDQTFVLDCPDLTDNEIAVDQYGTPTTSDANLFTARGHLNCAAQTDGSVLCDREQLYTDRLTEVCADPVDWPKNRFYSIRIFGGSLTPEGLETDPIAFDKARLTVGTDPEISVVNADTTVANSMSAGWYMQYEPIQERTATTAVTTGACVAWSSLEVAEHPGCSTSKKDVPATPCESMRKEQQAWMYFRNYITGQKDCISPEPDADGWDDERDRQDLGDRPQPPAPPQVVVQVATGGATQISVVTAEGADVPLGRGEDILQEFDTLIVPDDLHDWRHAACTDPGGNWICE